MSEPTVLSPVFERAVPIVFGADDGFFIPLVVCIRSIVENTSAGENYDIVVLANRFNEKYTALLRSMAEGRDNVSIRVYDVEPFLRQCDMSRLKTGHRLSLAAYYRLFIPYLMKDYRKVLYIDGDTVVLEDPAVLYGTDLTDCYAGVVKDYNIIRDMSMSFRHHVQQVLQMEHTDVYFNSGVLVLNLDLIRRDFPCRSSWNRRNSREQSITIRMCSTVFSTARCVFFRRAIIPCGRMRNCMPRWRAGSMPSSIRP